MRAIALELALTTCPRAEMHKGAIRVLRIVANSCYSAGDDGKIHLIDMLTQKTVQTFVGQFCDHWSVTKLL